MNITLIDGYNLFMRCFTTVDRWKGVQHTGGVEGFIGTLSSLAKKNDYLFVVWDGENSGMDKRKIFPEYKQGRRSKYTYVAGMKDEETDVELQFNTELLMLFELMEHLPVFNISHYGLEADDVIAYLVNADPFNKHNVTVFSSDKDYFQLLTQNSRVRVERKVNVYYSYKRLVEEYSVLPENFAVARAIVGDDKGDGIIGVKGIGFKTLVKNYPQFYQTVFNTLEEFWKIVESTESKIKEKLLNHKSQIDLMFQVIQLNTKDLSIKHFQTLWSNLQMGSTFDILYCKMFMQTNSIGDSESDRINNFVYLKRDVKFLN